MKDKSGARSSTEVRFEDPAETIKEGSPKTGKGRPRPLSIGRIISSISLSKSSNAKSEKSAVVSPRTALSIANDSAYSMHELDSEASTTSLDGQASAADESCNALSATNFLSIPGCKGSRSGCDVREGSASGDQSPAESPIPTRPNRHTVGSFDPNALREHGSFEFGCVPASPLSPTTISRGGSRELGPYGGSSSDDMLATFDLAEEDLGDAMMQDYSVGRTLGRGRYGKVKQAVHVLSGVPVALKIISKKALTENKEIANEVHALRELRHRNVMCMYDVIDTPNALVLVLELLDGGELFDYIVVRTKLSEKEARKFLRQILLGLRYCHARGIVHRDLKLENLLLDSNGDVKIGDFGFSNIFKADTLMSTFVGSAAYAAPEILANEQYVGPATDVWSLGVIMYTLLVGKQPFDHSGNQATFFLKVQAAEFEMPDSISPEAQDMIRLILRRDPQQRPTVAQLCAHPWISAGNDFADADLPDETDAEGDLDATIVEQLASAGIETGTLVQDISTGNLTRASAAYKLCKIGRVRDAINREQDMEINAIANMLAATRSSAGNSPLISRKRVPAHMMGQGRVASECGLERRVMSTESPKPLKRSPKASKKESFMTALSLSGGSGHDEDPGAISSPKPSKSVPKLRPVPRMRATTVSTTASVDAPGLVHPSYEARVNDEKKSGKRAAVPVAAPAVPSVPALPSKSPRAVSKKSSENELSRGKGIGSPLASRRETSASLTQDMQGAASALSINKSKESILSSRSREANGVAIDFDILEQPCESKQDVSRTSSLDPSVDGMDISCTLTVEPPSPSTPTTPLTPTTPMARRQFGRYVSERGAVDSLLSLQPGPGSPMFRMATEGDARGDFSSMPFLHNSGGDVIQGEAGNSHSAVTLSSDGTSASSPIRRKKSKMSHLRDMLAWGHGRDSMSSISSSSSMDSPGTPRSRILGKRASDAEYDPAPHISRGQSKHTVLSSATTSNKAPHRIVDEIVRVCKANKVKYVREGNIVMCIWKPGKKELRQLQDEVMLLDNDVTIRWEMEVHKIDKIDLHGIRLRRTGGDIWLYKTLCTRLMEQMKL